MDSVQLNTGITILLKTKYLNYGVSSIVVTTIGRSKVVKSDECNGRSVEGVCFCPLEGIIHTISRKWTLQIVAMIGNNGSLRYSEIQKMCSGISPTVLSERLKELEKERIVSRKAFAEIPPRVEYSLTDDGRNLRTLIAPLMSWASNKIA